MRRNPRKQYREWSYQIKNAQCRVGEESATASVLGVKMRYCVTDEYGSHLNLRIKQWKHSMYQRVVHKMRYLGYSNFATLGAWDWRLFDCNEYLNKHSDRSNFGWMVAESANLEAVVDLVFVIGNTLRFKRCWYILQTRWEEMAWLLGMGWDMVLSKSQSDTIGRVLVWLLIDIKWSLSISILRASL